MLCQSSDEPCGSIIPKLPICLEHSFSHHVPKEDIAFLPFLLFKLKVKRSVGEFVLPALTYLVWLGGR